ncbi:MAG: hypothetical protein AAF378_18435 [Cyanobacteria bacterium P01_A01_bin.84]
MRISVIKSNQQHIKNLANQWGMDEKECINFLITQHRLGNQTPQLQQFHQDLPTQDVTTFEYQEVATEEFETDPVIERLLNAGLDLEF